MKALQVDYDVYRIGVGDRERPPRQPSRGSDDRPRSATSGEPTRTDAEMPNDRKFRGRTSSGLVNQIIQEEASRARGSDLPAITGPLPADTDFIAGANHSFRCAARSRTGIRSSWQTLRVKVELRTGNGRPDGERAGVVPARRSCIAPSGRRGGLQGIGAAPPHTTNSFEPPGGVASLPRIWEIHGGQATPGLWGPGPGTPWPWTSPFPTPDNSWQWKEVATKEGDALVGAVSDAIGQLEGHGRFGPFAVVLGQHLFLIAQTPNVGSLVLPQDRIIPFLGGGSLLRSSTLGTNSGVVVALGGAPVELVLGTDVSLQFLQITSRPSFLFRVREKLALRIKEVDAIVRLELPALAVAGVTPRRGQAASSRAARR
jgi:hypothetical protein